jgi:hypothetical protein
MKLIKICLIIVNFALIAIFVKFFIADVNAKKVDFLIKNKGLSSALNSSNSAIRLNPQEPYYYRQRAKAFLLMAIQEPQNNKKYKQKALDDLNTALSLNYENLATIRNSIPYYYFLAKDEEVVSNHFILETSNFYKTTKSRFPTDAGVLVTVAKYEKLLGLTKEYEQSKQMIKKLRPDLLEWYPGIAY